MSLKIADRVRETSTTTGTGAMTLNGAVSGFQSFGSRLSVGDRMPYAIVAGNDWEVGFGTYSAANTLARTAVLASSNSDSLVAFVAGPKDVFLTAPASMISPRRLRIPVSAAVTLSEIDVGKVLDFASSNAISQPLPAAATIGPGGYFIVRNSGAGFITLSPNGSEKVDGDSFALIWPGEQSFELHTDGIGWFTVGRSKIVTPPDAVITSAVATADFETAAWTDPRLIAMDVSFQSLGQDSASSAQIYALVKKNGIYQTSGYTSAAIDAATYSPLNGGGTYFSSTGAPTTSAGRVNGTFRVENPLSAAGDQLLRAQASLIGDAAISRRMQLGEQSTAAAVTGLRLMWTTGNISTGVLRMTGSRR